MSMKHKWKKYDNDEDEVDNFAGVDAGYHNGPLCVRCNFSFCQHCNPGGFETECGAKKIRPDDTKLTGIRL